MANYEIFSARQKRARGEVPDVFAYDKIPAELRVQVIHIWGDTLGHIGQYRNESYEAYTQIHDRLCRDYGCYQSESGFIIRVDSQFLHSEAVKPALTLLADANYEGANAEFLKAFEHYRRGDTKECLNECLKAFESTMKAICVKRKWPFKQTDTAKNLIDVCLQHKLVPDLIQSQVSAFRSVLESGIPTIRNRLGGHGQGPTVTEVPMHYASYMLHLTATTIQFLVQAEKELA